MLLNDASNVASIVVARRFAQPRYPVLHVYPWQKLYPYAFTAGQWTFFPLDQIWDYARGDPRAPGA